MSRSSTQSKPFSFGLLAQPGAPRTGLPWYLPTTMRLPGSTGMPARMTSPPASRIAAGMTSSGSLIADAPNITTISLSGASDFNASATAFSSCPVRRSAVTRLPERASRASVTLTVLASTLSLTPGSTVWISPILDRPERSCGEGVARLAQPDGCLDEPGFHGERDDLDGRHHLAGFDRRIFGDGGDGDRRVDPVDGIDQRAGRR